MVAQMFEKMSQNETIKCFSVGNTKQNTFIIL